MSSLLSVLVLLCLHGAGALVRSGDVVLRRRYTPAMGRDDIFSPPLPTTRRAALLAAGGCLSSLVVTGGTRPALAATAKKQAALKESLVLILRVKEAAAQETRLVKTGKYKELQRLNVKRAINFMLDNYALRDRFVLASAFAPADQQQVALTSAQRAVESLVQIIEYFPQDLVVNDLTPEQKKFVLAALASASDSIDQFLELMPVDAVSGAAKQVAEENRLNEEEYPEDQGKILNAPVTVPVTTE
jgi:hypothetical protein